MQHKTQLKEVKKEPKNAIIIRATNQTYNL